MSSRINRLTETIALQHHRARQNQQALWGADTLKLTDSVKAKLLRDYVMARNSVNELSRELDRTHQRRKRVRNGGQS